MRAPTLGRLVAVPIPQECEHRRDVGELHGELGGRGESYEAHRPVVDQKGEERQEVLHLGSLEETSEEQHRDAHRLEFSRDYNDRTGQRYYLENAPYVDERDWDNVGFEAEVGAPSDFDPAPCYRAP